MSETMGRVVGRGLSALALTAVLGGTGFGADFQWQGRAFRTLEIKGVNGRITAAPSFNGEATVTAQKHARKSDPETVRIEVVEHAGGVTICAVYPSMQGAANECLPGEAGRMNVRDNDVNVDFTVRVPQDASFVARTVNGGIEAKGLLGDVAAHAVNGGIRLESKGNAVAETVNGSIVAEAGRADWSGDARFTTVNGSITVVLPPDASADVKAETVNGRIETDFPLQATGRFSSRRLSGRLGSGGRDLHLETVNGAIHLRHGR